MDMTATKIHLSLIRPNAFGGTTTGTLCNRFRCLADGMNLTVERTEVTCSFCLKIIARLERTSKLRTAA
jgi:hypothetical protein